MERSGTRQSCAFGRAKRSSTAKARGLPSAQRPFHGLSTQRSSRGALDQIKKQDFSLGALIRWYIDTFSEISNWQRTKQTSLEFLENRSITEVRVQRLTTAMLIDHIRTRRADGAGPAADAR